jgi:hypothetical protein
MNTAAMERGYLIDRLVAGSHRYSIQNELPLSIALRTLLFQASTAMERGRG